MKLLPRSIRWQLPLSYAAIALLATLALGAVLLTTLQGYYSNRERQYLGRNVQVIAANLEQMYREDVPQEAINAQLQNFALMSRSNVKLFDSEQHALGEANFSGIGDRLIFSVTPQRAERADIRLGFGETRSAPVGYFSSVSFQSATDGVYIEGTATWNRDLKPCVLDAIPFVGKALQSNFQYIQDCSHMQGIAQRAEHVYSLPVGGGLYGYDLDPEMTHSPRHSNETVQYPLFDEQRNLVGYVRLSQGPAYGTEIVTSVAQALVGAGLVAILLAAGVGWLVSQQITKPLLALTTVTEEMSGGKLSARVNLQRQDEFGVLAASFNEMAGRVETTVLMLQRFVADAAHELHTPLTALRTNLELAADTNPSIYVTRAQGQLKRLQALTTSLLDLARIEAGTTREKRTQVNLAELLKQMQDLYASRVEQAGLSFKLLLPPEALMLDAAEGQITRVMDNLLDNAVKFTPEDGCITLQVSTHQQQALIYVEDTGIGIPSEEIPKLFNRFHRARNATAYPGNGLGLVISKSIVEQHGGQIRVESQPHGTRFCVQLPLGSAP